MSDVTRLAETTISAFGTIIIELVENDGKPAVIVISWPPKASVLHPRRAPETFAAIVRTFAAASTELAHIRSKRGL